MEKLTLEEYKALGEAIKKANKNLKLIQKFIDLKELDNISDNFQTTDWESGPRAMSLTEAIGKLSCDLSNFAFSLESSMDEDYCNDILETIDFFN